MSVSIEETILQHKEKFYDNDEASGDELFEKLDISSFTTKPAAVSLAFPPFNLPYYEGFNRYNDKYWLGIYRRDELFRVKFLKEVCLLCLYTNQPVMFHPVEVNYYKTNHRRTQERLELSPR